MNLFPKILVAAPTAVAKKYCFESWLENTMQIKYPNFQIRLFDNSADNGAFAFWMNKKFHDRYGKNNRQFNAIHVKCESSSVIERMTAATEVMRQYSVKKGYSHLLSLESDVFAPHDVIEELLCHNKQVIGALYDRDEGSYRKLCIQTIIKEAPDSLLSLNFKSGEELNFVDGLIKKVSSVGLGCVLINMNTIKNIPFRYFEGIHPDQFFSETMHAAGCSIFSHTGIVCRHDSKEWGLVGIDFN